MNKLLHNEHNVLLPQVKTFSKLLKQIQEEYLHQKQLKQKQYTTESRSTFYTLCGKTNNRKNKEDKRASNKQKLQKRRNKRENK